MMIRNKFIIQKKNHKILENFWFSLLWKNQNRKDNIKKIQIILCLDIKNIQILQMSSHIMICIIIILNKMNIQEKNENIEINKQLKMMIIIVQIIVVKDHSIYKQYNNKIPIKIKDK